MASLHDCVCSIGIAYPTRINLPLCDELRAETKSFDPLELPILELKFTCLC